MAIRAIGGAVLLAHHAPATAHAGNFSAHAVDERVRRHPEEVRRLHRDLVRPGSQDVADAAFVLPGTVASQLACWPSEAAINKTWKPGDMETLN